MTDWHVNIEVFLRRREKARALDVDVAHAWVMAQEVSQDLVGWGCTWSNSFLLRISLRFCRIDGGVLTYDIRPSSDILDIHVEKWVTFAILFSIC